MSQHRFPLPEGRFALTGYDRMLDQLFLTVFDAEDEVEYSTNDDPALIDNDFSLTLDSLHEKLMRYGLADCGLLIEHLYLEIAFGGSGHAYHWDLTPNNTLTPKEPV